MTLTLGVILDLLRSHWKLALGVVAAAAIGIALLLARADARHWRKIADQRQSQLDATIANFKAAAAQAKADNLKAVRKIEADQADITEKVRTDYEARISDARARADALRVQLASRAHQGSAGQAGLSGLPDAPAGTHEASGQDGLPAPAAQDWSIDDRLLATEQAIQLDALITWVEQQKAAHDAWMAEQNGSGQH